MKVARAHCLFEQSGTFKNEFKKLGIPAWDYDILNDYGETDYQIDLFDQIGGGALREKKAFLIVLRRMILCLRFSRVPGLKQKCRCS